MSDSSQTVRIVIASYLEPHHVDRIRALNPRLEVVYEPHLLPRPRFVADHVGHAFERPEEDEKRWVSLLAEADVPGASVVELEDTLGSPQFQARATFVDVDGRSYVAQPARLSTGPIDPEKGPPDLNGNANKILEELDYSQSTSEAVP